MKQPWDLLPSEFFFIVSTENFIHAFLPHHRIPQLPLDRPHRYPAGCLFGVPDL